MRSPLRYGLILAALTGPAAAADSKAVAVAESVQPPVWIERAGHRSALPAGMAVRAGDQFITGAGGRLHIALHDHSVVKLGENGQLNLPALELKPLADDKDGLFSGALKVVKGAFRFTTSQLGKLRKREIDVSIGPTITAGIRGTDIWGKSETEQDLLCLIEGRIEIGSPGHESQVMDQAASFYLVPRDQAPLSVAPVPAGKLEKWVPQTELKAEYPALKSDGAFMVGLESSTDADAAQAAARRYSDLGYAAEIVRANVGGRTWYRVVITGLATAGEAQLFAKRLSQDLKLKSPWVMAPPNL